MVQVILKPADIDLLIAVNAARIAGQPDAHLETEANDRFASDQYFAVYGTLGPGKPNHHHVSDIKGIWTNDTVTGKLVEFGWGAAMGFPALVWSLKGDLIAVQLLQSQSLPQNWERLDSFEGREYVRLLVPLRSGKVANIYTHNEAARVASD